MIGLDYKAEKDMKKNINSNRHKKKRKSNRKLQRNLRIGLAVLVVILIVLSLIKVFKPSWLTKDYIELEGEKIEAVEPQIDVELLTVNPNSRPGQ